ncbi:hypothetical protein SAMN02745248_02356 [Hathewaya proteolytica DSM 3090]|uniref:Uncharacterized protein n=1 Tax=Hathewaya proteolytica DSM 3090 TaxID=1121331 RepID=A0A1M6RSL5_9CLOT|nr:NusG domain II-containing protein [Hathewaya proteolytica]SHK35439.1 hypothetical protein SAMN02745248_02356 [Hathewaya proteolytica DSM 3090]
MKMKKGDKFVVVLCSVVFICSIISVFYYFHRNNNDGDLIAEIYVNNEKKYTYNLSNISKRQTITIKVDDHHYNVIALEHNRIRFEDANCHDGVCVRTGWLNKKGEMAVCLPHKVYIKITGSDKSVDGVTF